MPSPSATARDALGVQGILVPVDHGRNQRQVSKRVALEEFLGDARHSFSRATLDSIVRTTRFSR